jgi:hypothetical protein
MYKFIAGLVLGFILTTYSLAEIADCCANAVHKVSNISIQVKGV